MAEVENGKIVKNTTDAEIKNIIHGKTAKEISDYVEGVYSDETAAKKRIMYVLAYMIAKVYKKFF